MSKTELAVILCRLVALYFIVNAIYGFGQSLLMFCAPLLFGARNQLTIQLVFSMALPPLFGLLIGLVLWRKAPPIGQKMAAS